MKYYVCDKDCGSFKIGNEDFWINLSVGDDGDLYLYILDETEELGKYTNILGVVSGKFNVYGYDGSEKDVLKYDLLETLEGKYFIVANENDCVKMQKFGGE